MSRWPTTSSSSPLQSSRPTLFLDRDGVVIVEKDYLHDAGQVELFPGVIEGLRLARAAGFQLVGVSNQSGLGRGHFTAADLDAVMRRLDALLRAGDATLDAFFYCPHAPQDGCACRKPAPGLLVEAGRELAWDPARSWVIGDKVSDVDLALGAGLQACLVRTGYGSQQERRLGERTPVLVADDLLAAVTAILEPA
jgi:D-glycero-D-manno-heptose 1,7-bisphosphate phosphatase